MTPAATDRGDSHPSPASTAASLRPPWRRPPWQEGCWARRGWPCRRVQDRPTEQVLLQQSTRPCTPVNGMFWNKQMPAAKFVSITNEMRKFFTAGSGTEVVQLRRKSNQPVSGHTSRPKIQRDTKGLQCPRMEGLRRRDDRAEGMGRFLPGSRACNPFPRAED